MIHAFKRKFPWNGGQITDFRTKIESGVKKHTFRDGFRRKVGMPIHFWDESPRNKFANPASCEFMLTDYDLAEFWGQFPAGKNKGGQLVELPMIAALENYSVEFKGQEMFMTIGELKIDTPDLLELVANLDGFDSGLDLIAWFAWDIRRRRKDKLEGQLVHWNTSSVYDEDTAEFYQKLN